VATGNGHSCAVAATGAVRCWGGNANGQLGNGTTTGASLPVPVTGVVDAASVTAGNGHSCAVTTAGAVRCWGGNAAGQLGNGTSAVMASPVTVVGLG
jgi:alpha-tubulin suppressor-like RCC1 family protein